MRAKAHQRSLEHAGRAGAARGDRGSVCGGLGACETKAVLGRARRCMLVLRAGTASGCSAAPPCSARSPPPWGGRSGVLPGCARAPGGGSCAWRGVGRASCSGAMRGVRRGTAPSVPAAGAGAGWWRRARGRKLSRAAAARRRATPCSWWRAECAPNRPAASSRKRSHFRLGYDFY